MIKRKDAGKLSVDAQQKIKEKNYWLNTLAGDLEKTGFPYDRPDNGTPSSSRETASITFTLEGHIYDVLVKISNNADLRLFILLTAGLVQLLYNYNFNNGKDILIGAPIDVQEDESDFINTVLVLRNRLDDNISFKKLLMQVSRTLAEAGEHVNYPLETLLYQLDIPYDDTCDFPLFDVAVLLEGIHDKRYLRHVKVNTLFSFSNTGKNVTGVLEYNPHLFEASTIRRIIRHYTTLLENTLSNLDTPISETSMLPQEERTRLLDEFNGSTCPYPREKTVWQLFEERARLHPERSALVYGDNDLTYAQLAQRASILGNRLKAQGAGPGKVIGLLTERSAQMVIGMLAILQSGAAYVPINPEDPRERMTYILDDAGARVLLTHRRFLDTGFGADRVLLDLEATETPAEAQLPPTSEHEPVRPGDPAYVIYTSGSTGTPKGVMVMQRNLVNLVYGLEERIYRQYPGGLKVAVVAPYMFDASVQQIFGALLLGHTLYVVPEDTRVDGPGLTQYFKTHRIEICDGTPAHLHMLCRDMEGNTSGLYLKHLIIGGEALPKKTVETFFSLFPHDAPRISNIYGPAECCVDSTHFEITPETAAQLHTTPGGDTVPIGTPMPNEQVYILGPNNTLLGTGVPGQLCITGDGLSAGYLNRPELTAERFQAMPPAALRGPLRGERQGAAPPGPPTGVNIDRHVATETTQDTSSPSLPSSPSSLLLYLTGDLARWLPDGNIEFLGRIDNQVKINGLRIEPGEIETRLLDFPGIEEAAVVAVDTAGSGARAGGKALAAYIVCSREPEEVKLREYLAQKLSDYMIPNRFIKLEHLPLTANGKVNRKALLNLEIDSTAAYVPPKNETEQTLAHMWQKVLGLDRVGTGDNFFHVGGDSIRIIQLITAVNDELSADIKISDLYIYQTIGELAAAIDRKSGGAGDGKEKEKLKGKQKEKQRAVAARVEELKRRILSRDPSLADAGDIYPMSAIEMGMTFHYLKDSEHAIYHDQLVYQLKKTNFDVQYFKKALMMMVEKHPILRTSFNLEAFDEPVQIVHKTEASNLPFYFRHHDISAMDEGQQEAHLGAFIKANRRERFDVETAPLWRMNVFSAGADNTVILWEFHHAVLDGWSNASFVTELNNTYLALESDPGFTPTPLKCSYKEFVLEQLAWKEQEDTIKYWRRELDGYKRISFPPPEAPADMLKIERIDLGAPLREQLERRAADYGTTLKHLCFAAYLYTHYMFSYENDLVAGLLTNNRPGVEDGDKVLGCFLNTVPVRFAIPARGDWAGYIRAVDRKLVELKAHDRLSLMDIMAAAGEKTYRHNPIFETVFNFVDFHAFGGAAQGDIREDLTERFALENHEQANTLFNITVDLTMGEFTFTVSYSNLLLGDTDAARFGNYFQRLLDRFLHDLDSPARKDSILTEEEKRQVLETFNDTAVRFDGPQTLHRLFERRAAATPEAVAAVCGDTRLTYAQLNRRADGAAHMLRARGLSPGGIVGLLLEDPVLRLVAMLAVLKAGGAYLPLDGRFPPERLRTMLDDCAVSLLLTGTNDIGTHSVTALQNLHRLQSTPCKNPAQPRVTDLDELPLTDRSLVDYEKYLAFIGQGMVNNGVTIQATRGCPFRCAYCYRIWPGKNISRSAEHLFQEVNLYYQMGVRRFSFIDDIFNLDMDNSARFFRLIIEQGLDVQFFFPSGFRGDVLTREYIDLAVQAGTVSFALALETASPRLQKMIRKNLDIEKFKENVLYILDKHPQVLLEFFTMHGFPTETEEEARMTLDFIEGINHRLHFPYVHILKIYPGTDMEQLALENGISREAIFYSEKLAYHELPLTLPFDKAFTLKYQAEFYNNCVLSKERLLHVLPYQVKVLTEDEMLQKYNSYLPVESKSLSHLLSNLGITPEEAEAAGVTGCLDPAAVTVTGFNRKLREHFPAHQPGPDALRILFLDLTQFFSSSHRMLYDVVEQPLGLLSILTQLNRRFGDRVHGRIAKSRIDFDGYGELKKLLREFKPHAIGIRTLNFYKDFIHETVALIRQWGFRMPLFLGGPYATGNPGSVLQDAGIDFVVLGEGELTACDLVESMLAAGLNRDHHEAGKSPWPTLDHLEKIPGIMYMKDRFRDAPAPPPRARELVFMDHLETAPTAGTPEDTPPPLPEPAPGDAAYVLYTSGSTGRPRGVVVEHKSVVNLVHWFGREYAVDADTRVLQLTDYTFDPCVEQSFGALCHGAALVLVPPAIRNDLPRLREYMTTHRATMINFIPSFLKELLAGIPKLEHLQTVIAGGERLEPAVKDQLLAPGYTLYNHYGPTEVTVDAVTGPCGPGRVTLGTPIANCRIYILDRNNQPQPPNTPGQLTVTGPAPARGYINNPELTAERFTILPPAALRGLSEGQGAAPPGPPTGEELGDRQAEKRRADSGSDVGANLVFAQQAARRSHSLPPKQMQSQFSLPSRFYSTGDLARWLPDGTIEFIERIDHQVKIRGYRVELAEIEGQMLRHPRIARAVVTAHDAGGETLAAAYFVPSDDVEPDDIAAYLARYLPNYMVPAFFIPMETLPLTPNGKIDRQALPAPDVRADLLATPPRNPLESQMQELWAGVLNLEKEQIGIDAGFFDLGGHSLKVTILAARIHKTFDVKLDVSHVFKYPTIRGLCQYLAQREKQTFQVVPPAGERPHYPLSSAQKRIYVIHRMEPQSTSYNSPQAVILEGAADISRLETAIKKLIQRHETLRTAFIQVDETPVQKVLPTAQFQIETLEPPAGGQWAGVAESFIRPFDLARPPLLRAGAAPYGKNAFLLLFDIHHIVSDGISMLIFIEEFMDIYAGKELPPPPLQYKDYSCWEETPSRAAFLRGLESYWLDQFRDAPPPLHLPLDFERPPVKSFDGDTLQFQLDEDDTRRLRALAAEEGMTTFMVLLALFNVFLHKVGGGEDITVGTAVAGRGYAGLERVMGVFVNALALRNFPTPAAPFKGFLRQVKSRTLEAYENQDYPFETLVEKVVRRRDPARAPLFDVMLAMQNFETREIHIPGLKLIPFPLENRRSKFDMTWTAIETEHRLDFTVSYCSALFLPETVRRFVTYFKKTLAAVLENPAVTIAEIAVIGEEEMRLMAERMRGAEGKSFIDKAARDTGRTAEPIEIEADFDL